MNATKFTGLMVAFAASFLSLASLAQAVQLSVSPSNVVGGSGSYAGTYNTGSFNATQIFDNQLSGTINETFGSGYWLNPDNGPANAYITVDLGKVYRIDQLDMFNANNGGINDRGTGNFSLQGGQRLNAPTGSGSDIGGTQVTVASGTLAGVAGNPISAQSVTANSNSSFARYVQFEPHTVAAGGIPCCGANNYGLDEIKFQGLDTQIPLGPSNVIGGSGSFGGTFNSGGYNATNVLDNQTSNNITEPNATGYWLNPDGGPANAYMVIDLGVTRMIGALELFNTHNGPYGDRGTGAFDIIGGNSVSFIDGTVGYDLTGATLPLVGGTLAAADPNGDPMHGEVFLTSGSPYVRYLRIQPHSVASFNASCCGANNYGLNEIRVYATPEPSSLALLGLGTLGLFRIARRRRA